MTSSYCSLCQGMTGVCGCSAFKVWGGYASGVSRVGCGRSHTLVLAPEGRMRRGSGRDRVLVWGRCPGEADLSRWALLVPESLSS